MNELRDFISELEKQIEHDRSYIMACLGSPFYISENYQRALKLQGLDQALQLARGFVIGKSEQALDNEREI